MLYDLGADQPLDGLQRAGSACSPSRPPVEIGYLTVSQDGAVLFFQIVNARHERAATVLTSKKSFEEWAARSGTG